MKKISLLSLLFVSSLAWAADGPGGPPTPIDTNQMILIIIGVLIMVGVITYKKLSVKKV